MALGLILSAQREEVDWLLTVIAVVDPHVSRSGVHDLLRLHRQSLLVVGWHQVQLLLQLPNQLQTQRPDRNTESLSSIPQHVSWCVRISFCDQFKSSFCYSHNTLQPSSSETLNAVQSPAERRTCPGPEPEKVMTDK